MDSTEDIDSVDLTEDEDSRNTVIESEIDNFAPNSSHCESYPDNSILHRMSARSPPPLTPIPRFTPFGTLATDQLPSVPKLTKIRRQNSMLQRMSPKKAVTLISSTVVKPAPNGSSISLESEDEDVSIIQDDIENLVNQKPTIAMPSITINATESPKQPGKLVVIKKNNKLYKIVIPHNVMPTTNQVGGPVLINIPEVGPLVIRIDPQAKNHILPKATQLEPFSLNFDEINKASLDFANHQKSFGGSQKQVVRRRARDSHKSVTSKEALLSDPCFCWSYTRIKQRDKDFFLSTDKLGFSKTEVRKTRRCRKILDSIVYKKTLEMKRIMDSFEELKVKNDKKHVIKPVEISKIVGESVSKSIGEPQERYNIQNVRLPPNTVITHLNDYDDLLMTRKIVLLNEDHTERPESDINRLSQVNARAKRNFRYRQKLKEKKILSAKLSNDAQPRQDFTNLTKPCYVKMLRENYIDQMYNNYIDNSTCTKLCVVSPKRPRIQPKLLPHGITRVIDLFMLKLIDTEHKFKAEMAYIKPVLVINEFNFSIVKYAVEFSKSNIVVAVDEKRTFPKVFLENKGFIEAVKIGYVKLIDSEILCRYLVGNLGPQSPKRVDM